MKQQSAIVILMSVLAGCGGGGGSGGDSNPPRHNDDSKSPPPSTPAGSVLGAAVSSVIGSEGGQLQSADGSVTLSVPAGAFSSDTTVSIQPISNEALGGVGKAFRIQPEGLHSSLPMTLQFHADTEALQGSALRFVTIGYQDSNGRWRVFEEPVHDESDSTVSIQTHHFSDWSLIAGVQLRPGSATLHTGASQVLEIKICDSDYYASDDPDDPDDLLVPFVYNCDTAPLTAFSAKHWAVNGIEGGGADSGIIEANSDVATGQATYTAPDSVPDVNPVAVSVEVHDFDNPADTTVLVSNIDVIEDASCESLKHIEKIDAGIAFERFQWTANTDTQAYQGDQLGNLAGTMTNLIPAAGRDLSPIGIWSSAGYAHTGLVAMNDTHWHFYHDETVVQQAMGSGLPYSGMDAPSSIAITVDYATCTYELVATFVVMGTVSENGASAEAPIAPGGIYYRETLPEEFLANGEMERSTDLPARYDPYDKINGYYPAGQNDVLKATGNTQVHWTLSLPQ